MRIRKHVDVNLGGAGVVFSDPIELSPRYSRVEFNAQLLSGGGVYDVEVQGIETGQLLEFQGTRWEEHAVSTDESDWMTLVEAESLQPRTAALGHRPATFSFYRAKVTSVPGPNIEDVFPGLMDIQLDEQYYFGSAIVVRFTVVGIRE